MTLSEVLQRFKSVTKHGSEHRALCPAHDDHHPSLDIKDGGDRALLICRSRNCAIDKICAAAGLTKGDLFYEPKQTNGKTIVDQYDYTDELGKVLYQVQRFPRKKFIQRKADGNGGWIEGPGCMNGATLVPFHLPKLTKAIAEERTIFITEGEKDALAMEEASFSATTYAGGIGSWRKTDFSKYLAGAEVVIIADKDDRGRKGAEELAASLREIAGSLKVIECPDIDGKLVKDPHDYFAAGGQSADLSELVDNRPLWRPIETLPVTSDNPPLDHFDEYGLRDSKPEVEPSAENDPWLALITDGADIQLKELPDVVEIVESILPEQCKLVICSGSKAFKTWLTMNMALCIAHGADFLGQFKTTRQHVLYANIELRPLTFERRLQPICKGLGIALDKSWFRHLPLRGNIAGADIHNVISRLIRIVKYLGVNVLVIDPLYKLNTGGDENSTRDQTIFFNELDRLTTEAECTVILNDHAGKGNQSEKDPLDVIRGSSAKGGDLDAAFVLRQHEVKHCYRVDLVHRELPPVDPFVIGWNYPLMEIREDLSADAMKKAKGGRKKAHEPESLLESISETTPENAISISGWATTAKVQRSTLREYLPEMRVKGWITTSGGGANARQFITKQGREALERWKE